MPMWHAHRGLPSASHTEVELTANSGGATAVDSWNMWHPPIQFHAICITLQAWLSHAWLLPQLAGAAQVTTATARPPAHPTAFRGVRCNAAALRQRRPQGCCTCRLKKMERRKEAKAEKAANLTGAIEAELMTRLKSGTYGDIYNFPMAQYNRVLDSSTVPDEQEIDVEGKQTTAAAAAEGDGDSGSDLDDGEHEFESEVCE